MGKDEKFEDRERERRFSTWEGRESMQAIQIVFAETRNVADGRIRLECIKLSKRPHTSSFCTRSEWVERDGHVCNCVDTDAYKPQGPS